ncbi:MAG: peptide chain release factor N(5)-glutamine methyltransferase [Prevotella sp.]|jgi:release factor glutamine methyltransferase|nr:peptide chain release factor N(5)-glutamine methyltransferase [Prevotella sp.]
MRSAIAYIKESLKAHYPEAEISGFTRIIAGHITAQSCPQILADKELSDKQQKTVADIVARLRNYEPIQYILEESEFFGLRFVVNKNVLIPRPETEELVELILNDNKNKKPGPDILDIGTGSGAIAIALAKRLGDVCVSAWDISREALDVAILNSKINSVNISLEAVDILEDYPANKKFDIIVSNPPYVTESEKETMERNVLEFEPRTALFVPDNDALLFHKRIADIAQDLLNPAGKLYFEINRAKGEETVKMLEEKGFVNVALFQDLSKNDRMTRAELKR